MKTFNIYKHPAGKQEAVKEGWSWPAFLFGVFWALAKRLWWIGGGLILAIFVLQAVMFGVVQAEGVESARPLMLLFRVLGIAVAVVFGIYGNSWRESNLQSRGFEQVDTVEASNPDSALALWINGGEEAEATQAM